MLKDVVFFKKASTLLLIPIFLLCLIKPSACLAIKGGANKAAKTLRQHGSTFYIDANNGNNGQSGTSPEQAWKTIDRLNKAENDNTISPGTKILFCRGGVYTGSIQAVVSGTNEAPVTFADYGTGDKPVINGFVTPASWQPVKSGIWQGACPACGEDLNMVLVNDVNTPMGRYPNADASNNGFLTFQNHSGNSSITGEQSPGRDNWVGADVVIRKNGWVIDRNPVTAQTGNTISFTSPTQWQLVDGYGYFFENSPLTLDEKGEWYYDAGGKAVQMFFGPGGPGGASVKVSAYKNLVKIAGVGYQTFKNFVFTGANENAFDISNANNIEIAGCDMFFCGFAGVKAYKVDYIAIQGCQLSNCNNSAFMLVVSHAAVRENSIKNCGLLPGMGGKKPWYAGMLCDGNNNTIEYNVIDSVGYDGISFHGDTLRIKNNLIDHFALVLDDAGGVYGGGGSKDRLITGNIILHGYGCVKGSNKPGGTGYSNGIYLDDKTTTVAVQDNTVAFCSGGIKIHNAHEITARNNILYDNREQLIMAHDQIAATNPIRNTLVTNNVLFSGKDAQTTAVFQSLSNDMKDFGQIDSNYYVQQGRNVTVVSNQIMGTNGGGRTPLELKDWENQYSQERHSKYSSLNYNDNVLFKYNATKDPITVPLDGVYFDLDVKQYTGKIDIAPYHAIILIKKR